MSNNLEENMLQIQHILYRSLNFWPSPPGGHSNPSTSKIPKPTNRKRGDPSLLNGDNTQYKKKNNQHFS